MRVVLRGLVPVRPASELVPWERISMHPNGRFRMLIPDLGDRYPLFASPYHQRIAVSAWKRSVRRRMRDGTLDISERYERLDWMPWIAAIGFIIWSAGLLAGTQSRILWHGAVTGGGTRAVLSAFAFTLSIVLLPALTLVSAVCLAEANVRTSRVTSEVIEAQLRGGRRVRQRWTDVRSVKVVRCSMPVSCADGTVLKFLGAKSAAVTLLKQRMPGTVDGIGFAPASRAAVRSIMARALRLSLAMSVLMLAPAVLLMFALGSSPQIRGLLMLSVLLPGIALVGGYAQIRLKLHRMKSVRQRERTGPQVLRNSHMSDSGTNGVPPRITPT